MTPQEINEMRMMMGEDKEQWASMEEHPGYEVSTHGRLRSYWGPDGWGKHKICNEPKRYLIPVLTVYGYYKVALGHKQALIHRLVAFVFLPNPQNLSCIDHIDRNRTNNHISNLRWCTRGQNILNSKIRNDNTSGKPGVRFLAQRQKWEAYWVENGKQRSKCFETFEEAAAYRDKMVQEHYDLEFYQEV